jgi:hypothetical protein
MSSVAVLTGGVVGTFPVVLMHSWNGSWNGNWSESRNWSDRKRLSEVGFVPLRAGAGLPNDSTKVTELMLTATSHVETAVGQLNHVLALGALLPFATPGEVHEELNVWVARAQALVSFKLAEHAGLGLAVHTVANFSLDILDAYELRAIRAATVRRVGSRELFDFEVEVLDELLRQGEPTYFQWDRYPAAAGRKERSVDYRSGEKVDEALETVGVGLRFASEGERIASREDLQADDALGTADFRVGS